MKEVKGTLKMLGNAQIHMESPAHFSGLRSGETVYIYSVIELGDTILHGVQVPGGLDNFLERGAKQDGTVILYLCGKRLVGVQLPDGKLYYYKRNLVSALLLLFFSVLMIPVLGIGLLLLPMVVSELRLGRRLRRQGGIVV